MIESGEISSELIKIVFSGRKIRFYYWTQEKAPEFCKNKEEKGKLDYIDLLCELIKMDSIIVLMIRGWKMYEIKRS